MKSFIFMLSVVLSSTTFGMPSDFKVTAPSSWKKAETSFPGTIYVNSASKKKQTILIYVNEAKDADAMPPAKIIDLAEPISKIREDRLASIGLDEYSTLSAQVETFKNAPKLSGLQIESQYLGYSDEMVQMVERQYFANGRIYNVVYTEETDQISDRAAIARLMDQFTPDAMPSREPASNEAVSNKKTAPRYESTQQKRKREKAEKLEKDRLKAEKETETRILAEMANEKIQAKAQGKRDWIEKCKGLGVAEKDIRDYDGDQSFGHAPGCIKGLVLAVPKLLYNAWEGATYENLKSGVSAVGSAASSAYTSVKDYFTNQTFRSQVNTSFVSAIETVKNTSTGDLKEKIWTNLSGFFNKHFDTFKCRSNLSQGEEVCDFVGKLAAGGALFKYAVPMLLRGASLTGDALAAVLKAAKEGRTAAAGAAGGAEAGTAGAAGAAGAGAADGAAGAAGAAGAGAEAGAGAAGASASGAGATGATGASGGFSEAAREAARKAADAARSGGAKASEAARKAQEAAKNAKDGIKARRAEAARKKQEAEAEVLRKQREAQAEAARKQREAQDAARKQREAQEEAARKQREAQAEAARKEREAEAAREAAKAASGPVRQELERLTKGFDEAFIDQVKNDLGMAQRVTGAKSAAEFQKNYYGPGVRAYMELMNKKQMLTPAEVNQAETYLKALNVMKDLYKKSERPRRNAA